MTIFLSKITRFGLSLFLFFAVAWVPVDLEAVTFKGKTVEWIIPFKAGGGSDKWARYYAPLLSKHLPGKPNVVVKNVPGGGSTKGANFFAERARPNGLTILGTSGSTQFPYLLDDPRVKYEYKDWNVVLGTPTGGVVYVNPEMGVKSVKDISKLKGKNIKYGSQGATSLDLIPLLSFELLDLDVEAVFGMKGRKDGLLAFMRGETTIDYQTTSSYLKGVSPVVKEGKAVPLFAFGSVDSKGDLVRDPTFPDLPHFGEVYEIVHGKKPSGSAFNAWKTFFAAGFPGQKMIFLPKGTSQEIIAAYRTAFSDVLKSSEFKKTSAKSLGKYKQVVGKDAETLMKEAITVDAASKKWIKKWLTDKYNVKL